MKTIFRKGISWLCVGLIAMGLLCGCSNTPASSSQSQAENAEKTEKLETKDELVICMGTRPPGEFDPKKRWGLYSQSQIIHSTLLKKTPQLDIVGDYAKKHEVSEDGLTWTFHLNDNYKFSNGESVTAEDVKFTYEMLKEHGMNWDLNFLDKIEIVDPQKIVFHLSEPRSTFFAQLTEIVILPHNHYDENYSENPIGSGPYKLVQWDKGQQAIFEVNPYYAGKKPHFKKFTLLFLDENAALAAAKNGTVDMIYTLPEFADEKIDGFKLFSYESNDVRGVSLPTQKSGYGKTPEGYSIGNDVTSDVAIRKALFIGLDRQSMVDTVLNGHGKKAYSLVDKMPWWNEETVVEDNRVDDAIKILKDAGWLDADGDGIREKDGLKATFKLYHPSADVIRTNTAIVVAEQAKKLGIDIELVGSNWDEMKTLMHSNAILFAGGRHHPHQFYTMHHPDQAGISYNNIVYHGDPTVTAYMEKAMHANTNEEANKYWKLAQWDGKTGASGLGNVPFVWLIRLDHIHLGDERINVGEQPIHTHGHEWSLLANVGEWTWDADAKAE